MLEKIPEARVFLSTQVRLGPPEGEPGDCPSSEEWDWKVLTEEGVLVSVSIFETKEGAEESNRVAAGWVKEGISLLLGRAEITAGEVVAHKTK